MSEAEIDPVTPDSEVADKREAHRHKLYSVPRRFDLPTIFIVTAAYSIVLGVLSAIHALPGFIAAAAVFIALVGIGQALLFRGRKPRIASVLAGVLALDGLILFYSVVGQVPVGFVIAVVIVYGIVGAILGYV